MHEEKTVDSLTWSALEYEERERSTDWFWALGVVIAAGALASIIYSNYFFAVLLVISGVLLGHYAVRKPDMVSYELNDKGLKIRNRLYPYENIKAFWVQKEHISQLGLPVDEWRNPFMLFVKSTRAFMPILSIPIADDMADDIRAVFLSKNIPEEEMKEHPSEKIMDYLGF